MKTLSLLVSVLALLLAAPFGRAQAAPSSVTGSAPAPSAAIPSLDLAALDRTADPCTDFYQYACGGWRKSNPVPADQNVWNRSFSLLRERNRYLLWEELESASRKPATALEKQYGDFYAACIDTETIERRGLRPLHAAWKQIDGLEEIGSLAALMARLNNQGISGGFLDLSVGQDDANSSRQIAILYQSGLSLPDRDYYLSDTARFASLRTQYLQHIQRMFELAGEPSAKAAAEARDALRIETELARAHISRTDLRDPANRYHMLPVAALEKLTPEFAWRVYFGKVGIGAFESLNVATPGYFEGLGKLLRQEPLGAWKSYLRWRVYHAQARALPKAVFDENFSFFGRTLAGQKEPQARWKQCVSQSDEALGEAVGQNWVKKNFPPEAKQSMDRLVGSLEKALGENLRTLEWMSPETRKAATEKLAQIRNKIGYPEKWRSYAPLQIRRRDYAGNLRRSAVFERDYEYARLGQPVDEKLWGMTPPTVNAYYDPSMNDVNFPAGILQPPFFDLSADPAVNYGGIGVVIGHELTHGFDDEGSQYDGQGNLREWWTPADRKAFEERTNCLVEEYGGFVAAPAQGQAPEQRLNGKLTLGENTADNGGLRLAYRALLAALAEEGKSIDEQKDGFTARQRYFLGFAQVWCQNMTDEAARDRALTDPHAPGRWRVNGSVRNFEEFGRAFGCARETPMRPAQGCRVW